MKRVNRDLLVLLRTELLSKEELELEVASLNRMVVQVESENSFCQAHELVTRYRITQRRKSLLKARRSNPLKPFHFPLNKN